LKIFNRCENTLVDLLFYMCRIDGMTPIETAINASGNAYRLAKAIDVPPQSVLFWRNGERRVPAEYCPRIELATNGRVRCEDLRPDVAWHVLRQATAPETTQKSA